MARATQGLQIALIISVMLNVSLGVSTYLGYKQAGEKTIAALAADKRVNDKEAEKKVVEDKLDRAKAMLGNKELEIDALEKKFDDDQTLAGMPPKPAAEGEPRPPIAMGYSQLLGTVCKSLDDRTTELKTEKQKVATLETDFRNREAAKDAMIAKSDQGFTEEKDRIKKIQDDYGTQQQGVAAEMARVNEQMKQVVQQAQGKTATAERKVEGAQKQVQALEKEIAPLRKTIRDNDRKEMDVPSGEITWVSIPQKTVWINRGRADALQVGIRFTVYSGDSNASATAVEKGDVEVTRIAGAHEAECRIVKDKMTDPIQFGDKVFTAFWSPGQQNHFALTGIMNLDGDGRNQVNAAIAQVTSYGGVVDCWLDEQGHRHGQITSATQYLVRGDSPDKSTPELQKANAEILREADERKLPRLDAGRFQAEDELPEDDHRGAFRRGRVVQRREQSRSGQGRPAGRQGPRRREGRGRLQQVIGRA